MPSPIRSLAAHVALATAGLMLMLALAWPFRERILRGHNDFLLLYAGARLVGGPDLYDRARVQERVTSAGAAGEALPFARPPYYALLLWPLGRLPYPTAYLVWEALSLSALLAFAFLWPAESRSICIIVTFLSFPAFLGIANGQDVTFLLLWISLALRFHRQEESFAAGLAFSLCAPKFHLFLLLPLVIAAQRRWRVGLGLTVGAATFVALSFAAGGSQWPQLYYHVLTDPIVQTNADSQMPNLHGLFGVRLGLPAIEWLGAALVIAAVWYVGRRSCFEYALACALAGGLLIAYHSYMADCGLLIPAALLVLVPTSPAWLRWVAVAPVVPVIYFTSSWRELLVTGILLFVAGIVLEVRRRAPETAVRVAQA